uniref:Uncharacterized protein n=1 Tax=Sinorhizobium arboris TaxID=76745 RepID=D1CSN7_9HYPH|nr:hypothetical protein [Sinorhizobium arboris LMG 14919]
MHRSFTLEMVQRNLGALEFHIPRVISSWHVPAAVRSPARLIQYDTKFPSLASSNCRRFASDFKHKERKSEHWGPSSLAHYLRRCATRGSLFSVKLIEPVRINAVEQYDSFRLLYIQRLDLVHSSE